MDIFKMTRLIMESFELALIVCNASSLNRFGLKRVLDVVCQILPTGYFLSTSYWPLYTSSFNECMCICGIFDLKCPHVPNSNHFLNLGINFKSTKDLLLNDGGGYVKLLNWSVHIERVRNACGAYRVTIKFKSQCSELVGAFIVKFRMVFCFPKYNYESLSICFDPHPVLHPAYGAHIPPVDYYKRLPLKYTVTYDEVPPFTLRIEEDSMTMEKIA